MSPSTVISSRFIKTVTERLQQNKRVRHELPGWGRVHIDRQLPFLCIYRRRPEQISQDIHEMLFGQASYLMASSAANVQPGLSRLVKAVAEVMAEHFGAFLILEIWPMKEKGDGGQNEISPPAFRIVRTRAKAITPTADALYKALREVKVHGQKPIVEVGVRPKPHPPSLPALLTAADARGLRCDLLGLEVRAVYRDRSTGDVYPQVKRELHHDITHAFKRAFFEYTRTRTTHQPEHYHVLGERSLVKAVWDADRKLAEVGDGFDLLLLVTPVNADRAWSAFRRRKFEREPEFLYRPCPVDPALAKRALFRIPIERIEDPSLAALFQDQQMELDRKLTMLVDRDTERFRFESLQLYGGVDDALLELAKKILDIAPAHSREEQGNSFADAEAIAKRARKEVSHYKRLFPDLGSKIRITDEIAGVMVSGGDLLIGKSIRVPAPRVEALVQHEVGTHILTYANGLVQPIRQLYLGLPGYESLQEGLSVLSEYLVGGLSNQRLRQLAARVVAVRYMLDGASFVEVFRQLCRTYEFPQRSAYNIAMRVFRGGGLTKDAVYLKGLAELLDYLQRDGDLELLYLGKFAGQHIPIIEELRWRKVLKTPPLRPRYLDTPTAVKRLDDIRSGLTLVELVKEVRSKT